MDTSTLPRDVEITRVTTSSGTSFIVKIADITNSSCTESYYNCNYQLPPMKRKPFGTPSKKGAQWKRETTRRFR